MALTQRKKNRNKGPLKTPKHIHKETNTIHKKKQTLKPTIKPPHTN